jgi:hypothetical protein
VFYRQKSKANPRIPFSISISLPWHLELKLQLIGKSQLKTTETISRQRVLYTRHEARKAQSLRPGPGTEGMRSQRVSLSPEREPGRYRLKSEMRDHVKPQEPFEDDGLETRVDTQAMV